MIEKSNIPSILSPLQQHHQNAESRNNAYVTSPVKVASERPTKQGRVGGHDLPRADHSSLLDRASNMVNKRDQRYQYTNSPIQRQNVHYQTI